MIYQLILFKIPFRYTVTLFFCNFYLFLLCVTVQSCFYSETVRVIADCCDEVLNFLNVLMIKAAYNSPNISRYKDINSVQGLMDDIQIIHIYNRTGYDRIPPYIFIETARKSSVCEDTSLAWPDSVFKRRGLSLTV